MISIVIGTFNAADTIERCLRSIIDQTSNDWEILVSDGASVDGTQAILERYSQYLSAYVSEPDNGVYSAWNQAIPRARGDWLMFLGADDQLATPDTITQILAQLEQRSITNQAYDFVYGGTDLIDGDRVIERMGLADIPSDRIPTGQEIQFAHTGLLHSRTIFERLGLFDEEYLSAGDYEFLLRAALNGRGRIARLPITIAHMAAGGMSNSKQGRLRHYRELGKARQKHGLGQPLWVHKRRWQAGIILWGSMILSDRMMVALANVYRSMRGKPPRHSL